MFRHADCNSISDKFFSNDNINLLLRTINKQVYLSTKQKIGNQSSEQLQIIMNYYFNLYGKSINTNIDKQIQKLNGYVLNDVIPMVINGVLSYKKYMYDSHTRPVPLEKGVSTSVKGTNSLLGPQF